jgi:hypothetical protein
MSDERSGHRNVVLEISTLDAVQTMNSLDLHSHKVQLIGTAIAASLATAALLTSYNSLSRRKRRRYLEEDIKRSLAEHDPAPSSGFLTPTTPTPSSSDYGTNLNGGYNVTEELIREQLARNYAFFGEEAMAKVRNSYVVIVGAGGVGSWASVMLARSYVASPSPFFFYLNPPPNVKLIYIYVFFFW